MDLEKLIRGGLCPLLFTSLKFRGRNFYKEGRVDTSRTKLPSIQVSLSMFGENYNFQDLGRILKESKLTFCSVQNLAKLLSRKLLVSSNRVCRHEVHLNRSSYGEVMVSGSRKVIFGSFYFGARVTI